MGAFMLENRLVIYDSGVGGLSLVQYMQTKSRLPVHYYLDNAGFPYGTKTMPELKDLIERRLIGLKKHYETILIACNTASMVYELAISPLSGVFPIIDRTIDEALLQQPKRVAVLGTDRLIASEIYQSHLKVRGVETINAFPLSDLVGQIESGAPYSVLTSNLKPTLDALKRLRPDVIILGCTHFNWLQPLFAQHLSATIVPSGYALVDDLLRKYVFTNRGNRLILSAFHPKTFKQVKEFMRNNHIFFNGSVNCNRIP